MLANGESSPIKAHAKIGVEALVTHPYFALFDEMGAMKTAQTIVATQFLYEADTIDRVIVITPASVRGVWFDPELGELKKHLWLDVPNKISEFHAKIRQWEHGPKSPNSLRWIVTNYEFIGRSAKRLNELLLYCGPKTLLVLDESIAVKSPTALQTKACVKLRKYCGRIVLLNGTPIANNPIDMLSQGNIMHPSILDCKWVGQFRDRYAVMASNTRFPLIVKWKNLEDLQQRFAPYVLRRLKSECLDLPEKLPAVTLTATLTPTLWKTYKAMRDNMVAWLNSTDASLAEQAAIRALRLAQITSGFLGGVEEVLEDDAPRDAPLRTTTEIGREKLNVILDFFATGLQADPNLKLLVWGRFRAEVLRMIAEVRALYPDLAVGAIMGGQNKTDRDAALRLLDPRTAPTGPVFVGGTYGTGSLGLNLTACHTVVNGSMDFSLYKFLQSADRVHRPGQVNAVSYFDVIAVGPDGQKTIDHAVVKALREKHDVAEWTTRMWLNALSD